MFQEFNDPRLVALYDEWGRDRADTAFYLALAEELRPSLVLDLGCGTGEITCAVAARGHEVWGVDPAPEMLRYARSRPGAELVRWIEGDVRAVSGAGAELALMTGHVAQVIADQDAWRRTLEGLRTALRPGGQLVFDSRNPPAREWLTWTPDATRVRWQDTPFGTVEVWTEVTGAVDDLVRTAIHYRFVESGDEATSTNELRFRSRDELDRALAETGFTVRDTYGYWDREPVEEHSPELIYIAVRDEDAS